LWGLKDGVVCQRACCKQQANKHTVTTHGAHAPEPLVMVYIGAGHGQHGLLWGMWVTQQAHAQRTQQQAVNVYAMLISRLGSAIA